MTATPDLAEGRRLLGLVDEMVVSNGWTECAEWAVDNLPALLAAAEERDRLREALTLTDKEERQLKLYATHLDSGPVLAIIARMRAALSTRGPSRYR